LLGRHWRTHRLALAGIGVLLVYLLLRVADIERLGEMTGLPLAAAGVRDALEWIGLMLIAAAAWRRAVMPGCPPCKALSFSNPDYRRGVVAHAGHRQARNGIFDFVGNLKERIW